MDAVVDKDEGKYAPVAVRSCFRSDSRQITTCVSQACFFVDD